jgi:N-acetylmuramoyl-L-alanine amidase
VLTENLFQDNKADVEILQSAEGKRKLTEAHVQGIIDYIKAL